ncbi:hypothetical protein SAMN05892877_12172 [Rhizobium subbaraonis]|uniref:Uncharacterized protein n=1 Tax=Rhizobium subbaraonis TaxID=908946 RepID=A0A285UY03_9HYPH|nr:hypothetical protein [Rhizobium subbaraonis]SOC46248.1 hypothetical protein SAMN05892877_12172 [Rhizobium subbaraonis]
MKLDEAKTLFPEIRQQSGLASDQRYESFYTATGRPEILCHAPATGQLEPIATILPDCSYDDRMLMQKAPVYIRALLVLLDEAFRRLKELQPKPEKAPNFAAECAMKCKDDHLFRNFLHECHGADPSDLERIKTRVRSILGVQSMTDLNTDENARKRWLSLRDEFHRWRKRR